MASFESKLKKLTKKELVHLVAFVLPTDSIVPAIRECQDYHKMMTIDCWECKHIYRIMLEGK